MGGRLMAEGKGVIKGGGSVVGRKLGLRMRNGTKPVNFRPLDGTRHHRNPLK